MIFLKTIIEQSEIDISLLAIDKEATNIKCSLF